MDKLKEAIQYLGFAKQYAEEAPEFERSIDREVRIEMATDYAKQAAEILAHLSL